MYERFEHYHCAICGERYPTREGANKCFWEHTELEVLRWIAFEIVAAHHFAGNGGGPLCKDGMVFSAEFVKELNKPRKSTKRAGCGHWQSRGNACDEV